MSHPYKIWRVFGEVLVAAVAGMVVVILPVIIAGSHPVNSDVFLPVFGEAVEKISFYTLGILFAVGVLLGIFGRGPILIIGPATMLVFPIWSAIDMMLGGTGHDLWPMEWFCYAVESLFSLAGAGVGRLVRRWWTRRYSSNAA